MKKKLSKYLFFAFIYILFSATIFGEKVTIDVEFNQCEILENLLISNPSKISFNLPYSSEAEYSGIDFYFKEDTYPLITKIHPKSIVNGQLITKAIHEIVLNEKLIKINGKDVLTLDKTQLEEEFYKESIFLEFENFEDIFEFKLQSLSWREVLVRPELNWIKNINTKEGKTDISLGLNVSWSDTFISREANKLKGVNSVDGSWVCIYPIELFKELGYALPKPVFDGFEPGFEDIEIKSVKISYYPPELCTPEADCDSYEKEHGETQLQYKKEYLGILNSAYNLEKFPFDTQEVVVSFYLENLTQYFDDPTTESRTFNFLDYALTKNNFLEWDLLNYDVNYGTTFDVLNNEVIPTFNLSITVKRESLYYLFKIMFPIFCLVFICYSVFWIHPRQLESRVTISIVCLLSLIAYNFVIDGDIPKLAYLTFLDKYILLSYLFAGIPTIQTVIARRVYENSGEEKALNFDYYSKALFPLGFFIIFTYLISTI